MWPVGFSHGAGAMPTDSKAARRQARLLPALPQVAAAFVSGRSKASMLLIASVAILSGCATERPAERPESEPEVLGIASVYANELRGRLTADGERYNPDALTAASLQFPLGTHVRVENLANGKHVVVRINDRGPYDPGRIIDLSARAARALGLEKPGLAKVRVQAVGH